MPSVVRLTVGPSSARAMPKSVRYATPRSACSAPTSSTFDGFTSRCTRRLGVRGVERVGHLGDHVHRARGRERAALDEVREVAAVDEAHVDEELAVDLAVVVDRDDVRVGELRRQRRLALEPAAVLLVGGQLAQEALQRDEPLTARVVGAVDLAHATAPDQGVEPVGPEDLRLHIGQTTGRATATDVASRQTTHTRPSRPATIATGPPPTSTRAPRPA